MYSDNKKENVGKMFLASDGGNYGIFIVGYLGHVDDYVVMPTIGAEIDYSYEPHRIDSCKAAYRYGIAI